MVIWLEWLLIQGTIQGLSLKMYGIIYFAEAAALQKFVFAMITLAILG